MLNPLYSYYGVKIPYVTFIFIFLKKQFPTNYYLIIRIGETSLSFPGSPSGAVDEVARFFFALKKYCLMALLLPTE